MLDAIRTRAQSWMAKVILALMIVPFALWGVDSYMGYSKAGADIATVDGVAISRAEFDKNLQSQQERLRAMMGGNVPAGILDSPAMRESVLDQLIDRQLLKGAVASGRLVTAPAVLAEEIRNMDAFKEDGAFSTQRYEELLKQNHMTTGEFEKDMSTELAVHQLLAPFERSGLVSSAAVSRLADAELEQRKVSVLDISSDRFMEPVGEAEAKAYYDSHHDVFKTEERVKVAYLLLSQDELAKSIPVDDAEIDAYYKSHQEQFSSPEKRSARHILIKVPAGAPAAEDEKAKKKAEELAAKVKADPASFVEVAKESSDDPGSAAHGGDLGFFGRASMVKPFADAAFSMKKGEISAPVRSDYGYHIIQLTDIRPGEVQPLAEVRDQIVSAIQREKAVVQFADKADTFTNVVYEQSDSLEPAAKAVGLEIRESGWLTRNKPNGAFTQKVLEGIFSPEVLDGQRNSEAIDAGPNKLVSARVTAHEPAAVRPFAEVKADIEATLAKEKAEKAAVAEGEAWLKKLQAGESVAGASFGPEVEIGRKGGDKVPANLVEPLFSAPTAKLPAYVGAAEPGKGYAIVRIDARVAKKASEQERSQAEAKARSAWQQQLTASYVEYLKQKAQIEHKASIQKEGDQPGAPK